MWWRTWGQLRPRCLHVEGRREYCSAALAAYTVHDVINVDQEYLRPCIQSQSLLHGIGSVLWCVVVVCTRV
jgi:hypothetical protein